MKHFVLKTISLLLILAVAILAAACGESDPSRTATADEKTQETAVQTAAGDSELQEKLEKKMDEYGFSGVYRVSKNGVVLSEGANGKFSPESDQPITVDDLFPIASVSKQFCATCVLLLREEGKLDLGDTLDKYYPEYARAKDITLKQMLTMRSGIPDYVTNGVGFDAYIQYDFSDAATEEGNHQAVRDWIFSESLLFEPGEDFSYSDSNYFLLAEIVQTISGKPYGNVLRERIFSPLGMNDTGVCEELMHSERMVAPVNEEEHKEVYTIGATFGNGGIITTVADMDKWLTSLREHTILNEACYEEMTTVHSPEFNYGYGICVNSDGSLSHEGGADSYASFAYTIPEKGYNLFIVTNNVNDGYRMLVYEIMNCTL